MSINIKAKTDYSTLFNSLGTSSTTSNLLADYAAIKNGSYGKLMKAYYSKDQTSEEVSKLVSESTSTTSSTTENVKALTNIEKSASDLKDSVDSLISSDYESEEDAFKAVKSMISDYNSLIEKAGASDVTGIQRKTSNLTEMTASYEDDLKDIGITIGSDNKLSIDEDTFMNADMSKVEELFNSSKSFGQNLSANALLINSQANYEATRADLYDNSGSYSSSLNIGSLMDSLF